MSLFVGHNSLLTMITAAPWGAARLGATVRWRDSGRGYRLDGRRDPGEDSQGAGGPRRIGGTRGAGGVIIRGGLGGGCPIGGDQILIVFYFVMKT
jgi:hypothetical protein